MACPVLAALYEFGHQYNLVDYVGRASCYGLVLQGQKNTSRWNTEIILKKQLTNSPSTSTLQLQKLGLLSFLPQRTTTEIDMCSDAAGAVCTSRKKSGGKSGKQRNTTTQHPRSKEDLCPFNFTVGFDSACNLWFVYCSSGETTHPGHFQKSAADVKKSKAYVDENEVQIAKLVCT